MNENNLLYWIWLADRCGVESKDFTRLHDLVPDPFALYRMEPEELEQLPRIPDGLKERLGDKTLADAYEILRFCKAQGVTVLTYEDARYPMRLRELEAPPVVLYLKGRLPDWNRRLCVGMVGTRAMSEYGKQTAYKISYELAAAGAVVVSGMALGVDGVCACGALAAEGFTVAVLGCGIDVVYPKNHTALWRAILRQGAVITEYPPHAKPMSYHFPQRNRIISGLCAGLLVVEGTLKSGSMITARTAVAQGRDLFALPGQVDHPNSEGPVMLIREGAYVARSADDLLKHYETFYQDVLSGADLARARQRSIDVEDAMGRYGVPDYYGQRRGESRKGQDRAASEDGQAPKERTKGDPKPKAKRDAKGDPKPEATDGQPQDRTVPGGKMPTSYREAVTRLAKKVFGETYETLSTSDDGAGEAQAQRSAMSQTATEQSAEDPLSAVLATLDTATVSVYHALPEERPFSPDEVVGNGLSAHDVATYLTILNISGLVEPLPGGQYRKSKIASKGTSAGSR